MEFIGYGEDGLTCWALLQRFGEIFDYLASRQSSADSKDCTVFYRPSVGRGIGGCFGEFDAIIGLQPVVYLVENKWESQPAKRPAPSALKLDETQTRRHRAFEWIKSRWDEQQFESWSTFVEENQTLFAREFHPLKLVKPGRRLAHNLEFLLRKISGCRECRHLVLYFHQSAHSRYTSAECKGRASTPIAFEFLPIQFTPIQSPSLFFHIGLERSGGLVRGSS